MERALGERREVREKEVSTGILRFLPANFLADALDLSCPSLRKRG
jgi:hypothetical protein